ncbi:MULTISPECIES: hypothetical protein [Providencia]|uniref:Uncharacterized protein n=2 Tax=Providencia TaxID=586 RepID=A0ABD5L6P5_PROST|nr:MULTISPECIES: hypothetical protein [Providencia]ELR5046513.1 hypothetical protein [Providencia rettgeri]MBZ3680462.1 hypothetical protein [Providencia rettgeri]MCG9536774.1 hypothetical protein [Providencia huaxiensis]MCR4180172.1 hypothetical protein [Providencia vermicola]MDT0133855.1 hypothetical protein [Providencia huaxiensis]
MKRENVEKIAFCFPSSQTKEGENGLVVPILVWVVQDDIDYMSYKFKVWFTIGFIKLVKKLRYIVKINVYKNDIKLPVSPHSDAGVIIEPDNVLSRDGRVAADMTEEICILAKPEDGIYKVEVSLHPSDNEEIVIDSLQTYFDVYVDHSLMDKLYNGKN